MSEMASDGSLKGPRLATGYFWGVTASTLSFFLIAIFDVIEQRSHYGTLFPIEETIGVIGSDALTVPFLWIATVLLSAIPSLLALVAAERFHIKNMLYYLLVGLGAGVIADLLLSYLFHDFKWYTSQKNDLTFGFWQSLITAAPNYLIAGGIGGVVVWVTGIKVRKI